MVPGHYEKIVLRPMNGTNFAEIAKNGLIRSIGPTGIATPGAYANVAPDVPAIVNAALGVANLAVGIYTAYQVHQTRKDIAAMRADLDRGFAAVRALLSEQSCKLDVILEAQDRHDAKLDLLLARVELGTERISDELSRAVSTLRTDEFRKRIVALDRAKRSLAHALEESTIDEQDLREAERCAAELADFCRARLLGADVPLDGRQAFWMARVDAEVVAQDCRLLRRGQAAAGRAAAEGRRLVEELREEMRLINRAASPWQLAKYAAAQTARYHLLAACLEQRADGFDGSTVEAEVDFYDAPGSVLTPSTTDERHPSVALATIADYAWYTRAFDLDPETLSVHSVNQVTRRRLEHLVGAPVGELSVASLRVLSDPNTWSGYQHYLRAMGIQDGDVPAFRRDPLPRGAEVQVFSEVPEGRYSLRWSDTDLRLVLTRRPDGRDLRLEWRNSALSMPRFFGTGQPDGSYLENFGAPHSYIDPVARAARYVQLRHSARGVEVRLVGEDQSRLATPDDGPWCVTALEV